MKRTFLFAITMIILIIAGCNSDVTKGKGEKSIEEVEEMESLVDESIEDESDELTLGDESNELELKDEEIEDNLEKDKEKQGDNNRLGDYHVVLSGEVVETEDTIQIYGESNLIPGARLVGEVLVGEDEYFADTTELVEEDGSFYMEIPHHDLNKETNVVVKFHFDGHQEDEIKRHYGDRGQELIGPFIYKHQGEVGGGSPQNIYQMAKVETTIEPGEELAVRQLQEPQWYELPDDLGDTRVWMEVLDITNDEEYFYLHGRSNLIEGSRLTGKYAGKRDETRVKPDGSFDMMFEYEYNEDASFVVEFDPSHWSQWNIVKETYGENGQKLVGNLVEKNKYNNNQSIVIEEKLESTEIQVPENVELKIDGPEVMMLVPDNLLFDFDEYKLKEDSKDILSEISKTLETFDKDVEIEVSGHTDNVGNKQYNLELSEKRAKEVKEYLLEKSELSETDITTIGYGETKPIASNEDKKGQAKNRRVEIMINLR